MEKEREKLFAEINNQEIRYSVFKIVDDSNYTLITKKNSKNDGIKHGLVTDLNAATETVVHTYMLGCPRKKARPGC